MYQHCAFYILVQSAHLHDLTEKKWFKEMLNVVHTHVAVMNTDVLDTQLLLLEEGSVYFLNLIP